VTTYGIDAEALRLSKDLDVEKTGKAISEGKMCTRTSEGIIEPYFL
jgi:hypothetical protein